MEAKQSHEIAQRSEYQQKFAEIVGRELDAYNIDTYADKALDDLVALTVEITEEQVTDNESLNGIENEQRALAQVGLDADAIETTLDHISEVADSTKRLDSLIAKKRHFVPKVIVPTDAGGMTPITQGDGGFEKPKATIPKLKTLMLLLEKGLDINIEDEALTIDTGETSPDMMRKVSYDVVAIPQLERVVLSCDEVGNTSFVFDTEVCEEYGITPEYLAGLSKTEMKDLLEEDGRLGIQIDYSKGFANRLATALTEKFSDKADDSEDTFANKIEILKPKVERAPEGYLSESGIYRQHKVARHLVRQVVAELGESLGEVKHYLFGTRTAIGYSPEQQQKIIEKIDITDIAPEGFVTIKGISTKTGIAHKTIAIAVNKLGDSIGEVKEYRFGSAYAVGYSPEQQKLIIESMSVAESAPAGYMSAGSLRDQYRISHKSIKEAAEALQDVLGEVKEYRFGHKPALGFSPQQISLILEKINAQSFAPEGYLSVRSMASIYGTSTQTIDTAIEKIGISLGEVKQYRFRSITSPGYSPEQQRIILNYLHTHSKRVKLGEAALNVINRMAHEDA